MTPFSTLLYKTLVRHNTLRMYHQSRIISKSIVRGGDELNKCVLMHKSLTVVSCRIAYLLYVES